MNRNLEGVRELEALPDAIFVVDPKKEGDRGRRGQQARHPGGRASSTRTAIRSSIDYVIPGNDDAIRTIRLFAARIADAYLAGAAAPAAGDDDRGEGRRRRRGRRPAGLSAERRRRRGAARLSRHRSASSGIDDGRRATGVLPDTGSARWQTDSSSA